MIESVGLIIIIGIEIAKMRAICMMKNEAGMVTDIIVLVRKVEEGNHRETLVVLEMLKILYHNK